jgi:hypothetical protein
VRMPLPALISCLAHVRGFHPLVHLGLVEAAITAPAVPFEAHVAPVKPDLVAAAFFQRRLIPISLDFMAVSELPPASVLQHLQRKRKMIQQPLIVRTRKLQWTDDFTLLLPTPKFCSM